MNFMVRNFKGKYFRDAMIMLSIMLAVFFITENILIWNWLICKEKYHMFIGAVYCTDCGQGEILFQTLAYGTWTNLLGIFVHFCAGGIY